MRWANYWKEGRAHVDDVQLIAIDDSTARQSALMTGEINVINRVDLKTLDRLKANSSIRIAEVQGY